MKYTVPVGVCLFLIIVTGVVQGIKSERWGAPPDLKIFSKRLETRVVEDFGEWKAQELPPNTPEIRKQAKIEGEINRLYHNERTGQDLNVWVACGRVVDLFYHNPSHCMVDGSGYTETTKVHKTINYKDPDPKEADFFCADYSQDPKKGIGMHRIYFSWAYPGGDWLAAEKSTPFAGKRVLYKIYVMRDITSKTAKELEEEKDPCIDFLEGFLPLVRDAALEEDERHVPESTAGAQAGS